MDSNGTKREGLRARMRATRKAMGVEIREHKSSFIVYMVLRTLVLVTMVLQFLNGNYENVFLCVLTLILLTAPSFVQVTFKIEFPSTLEIIILVFIFAAEILGEISSFYELFPFWDTVLHTINGFLAAAIGFSLVDLLNRRESAKFSLSPSYLSLVAFCFSMTIGVLWEFFEYTMDNLFGWDMQKDSVVTSIHSVLLNPDRNSATVTIGGITSTMVNGQDLGINGYLDIGLRDTMNDLIVNFIGAAVFCVFGFIYVKSRGKNHWIRGFVPSRKHQSAETSSF